MGLQTKLGDPACCYRHLMQVLVLSACRVWIGFKACVIVFVGWHFKIVDIILSFQERLTCSMEYEVCCVKLLSL